MTLSQRQRLNNFIERRWFEIGQPPLLRQHKYSILLRTIRRESVWWRWSHRSDAAGRQQPVGQHVALTSISNNLSFHIVVIACITCCIFLALFGGVLNGLLRRGREPDCSSVPWLRHLCLSALPEVWACLLCSMPERTSVDWLT